MALSSELNVSGSAMKFALNEDICCYSFLRRRRQQLTEKARENRLTKGMKLLSNVKHSAEPQSIWLSSDEKTFAQIKGTTRKIIDGLHIVQRTLLVSCRLNFHKL